MSDWNLAGKWNEIKGRLKADFANLTDDDLNYQKGKEEQFLGNLQHKLGKTKDELVAYLEGFHKDSPSAPNNNNNVNNNNDAMRRG